MQFGVCSSGRRWRFFLAGVMQGSFVEKVLYSQDYRQEIARLLTTHFPEAEVFDPLAAHRRSLDYDRATGQQVFWGHNFLCRHVDVLVAYLPEASMGTAIEMWEAFRYGAVVISISPMRRNWVVRFLSHAIYADLEEFAKALAAGEVRRLIERHLCTSPGRTVTQNLRAGASIP
ncbi:MAG: hypothetical protein RMJ16_10410 [Thermoguttaceae bacterium]|nr:hypothetical protein [Thermoguttaceae bacterium]